MGSMASFKEKAKIYTGPSKLKAIRKYVCDLQMTLRETQIPLHLFVSYFIKYSLCPVM